MDYFRQVQVESIAEFQSQQENDDDADATNNGTYIYVTSKYVYVVNFSITFVWQYHFVTIFGKIDHLQA